MENDISVNNNLYIYYYIDKISLNHIEIDDATKKISDIYIKNNMACKIFCCLVFSAKLVFLYFLAKTISTAFDKLFPSAISDFKNIEESKLNLFKGIGKFILSIICLVPALIWTFMIYGVVINLYVWTIFGCVWAAAILIMTVISTICLCRSNPVHLYAYESKQKIGKGVEIVHKFAEKMIDENNLTDLTPLQGNRISFREKIFIYKKEIIRVQEDGPEI